MSTVVDLRHDRVNDNGMSQLRITLMFFIYLFGGALLIVSVLYSSD